MKVLSVAFLHGQEWLLDLELDSETWRRKHFVFRYFFIGNHDILEFSFPFFWHFEQFRCCNWVARVFVSIQARLINLDVCLDEKVILLIEKVIILILVLLEYSNQVLSLDEISDHSINIVVIVICWRYREGEGAPSAVDDSYSSVLIV